MCLEMAVSSGKTHLLHFQVMHAFRASNLSVLLCFHNFQEAHIGRKMFTNACNWMLVLFNLQHSVSKGTYHSIWTHSPQAVPLSPYLLTVLTGQAG